MSRFEANEVREIAQSSTKSVTSDATNKAAMSQANTGLILTGAMLIIPQFTLIHPYLHLLIMAPLLVFTGCHRAKLELDKGAASQVRSA